jgi:hypothetical protein
VTVLVASATVGTALVAQFWPAAARAQGGALLGDPPDRNDPNRAVAVFVEYTFDPNAPNQPSQVVEPDQVRSHQTRDPNMTPGGQNPPQPRDNHPDWPGRSGLYGLSGANQHGFLRFVIQNYPVKTNDKYVKIEYDMLTNCIDENAGKPPVVGAPGSSVRPVGKDEGVQQPDGSYHFKVERVIKPQPKKETVTIPLNTGSHPWDYVYIDNISISTKCVPKGQDPNDYVYYSVFGSTRYYYIDMPAWPPAAYLAVTSPWSAGESWSQGGSSPPVWLPGVTDHEGVLGLPGGYPADATVGVHLDGQAPPVEVQYVDYQFDFYAADGGMVWWEPLMSPGTLILDYREEVVNVGNGWQRVYLAMQVAPPPMWQELNWTLVSAGRSGPVVIDNILLSDSTSLSDFWRDPLDLYEVDAGLHGQEGWKGWDNSPAADGFVTDSQAYSPFNSLAVAGPTDLVRPFEGFTSGRHVFTAWEYVPIDFQSYCDPYGHCGSYLILLNTYNDGGPYNWSVQLHADSVTGTFIRDGQTPVSLPLITGEWVAIDVLVDLDADLYRVYYDGEELGAAASWSAGIYGGGGGAVNIGALDLYANSSSPVYYDDLFLRRVLPGDLNCDARVDFDDINPFVLALSDPTTYMAEYLGCTFLNGDCNNDGRVDFDDINAFVQILSGGL